MLALTLTLYFKNAFGTEVMRRVMTKHIIVSEDN